MIYSLILANRSQFIVVNWKEGDLYQNIKI